MYRSLQLALLALVLTGCGSDSNRRTPDTEPPQVVAPADITITATSSAGIDSGDTAIQSFLLSATATDNIGVDGEITNDAPAVLPIGTTLVTFNASDAAGNTGSATASIVVTEPPDTEDPVVTPPDSITLPAATDTGSPNTEPAIAAFLQAATATDNRGLVGAVANNAPTEFLIGDNVVVFSASDAAGNVGSASATVTITDATNPVVTAPTAASFVATESNGRPDTDAEIANFLAAATATDNVGISGDIENDAPTLFPFGETVVTFTATDAEGNSSTASSTIRVTLQDTAYLFSASNGSNGYELWRTDGTADGTAMVRDINAAGSSAPNRFIRIEDYFYFVASDGATGRELWRSDGSDAGTTLVKDINPGMDGSNPSWLTRVEDKIYFSASDALLGDELWVSDGTEAGTQLVKDIFIGSSGSSLRGLVEFGGEIYFAANDDVVGVELWKSDGTDAGTVLVADIFPGTRFDHSYPEELTVFGDALLFRANDGQSGTELWRTDGTTSGTTLVADIAAGIPNSFPENLVVIGDVGAERLVFAAQRSIAEGTELWVSDGSASGTTLLLDIKPESQNPGFPSGSNPFDMTVTQDGTLYFLAERENFAGPLLFSSDGTPTGTALVMTSPAYSTAYFLSAIGNQVIFSADSDGNGRGIWLSDGTTTGTLPLLDVDPDDIARPLPRNFVEVQYAVPLGQPTPRLAPTADGSSLLILSTPGNGHELWRTNGTETGTEIVLDIDPGVGNGISPGAG